VVAVFLPRGLLGAGPRDGALWALARGIPLGVVGWSAVEILDLAPLPFLHASGIKLGAGELCVVFGILLTPPLPAEQVETRLWRPALWHEEAARLAAVPWYRDPRVLSRGLLALSAALLIWWW
jgi:hypothetical protein